MFEGVVFGKLNFECLLKILNNKKAEENVERLLQDKYLSFFYSTQRPGYLNEVRILNIAELLTKCDPDNLYITRSFDEVVTTALKRRHWKKTDGNFIS